MARRRSPISLVMIVRDEARVLARCLDSVTGLVDEIVVVDTGSTDDTIAIATSYGAQVHHFTWVDDFAAARNHALSKATHPWRLVLDADEWIVDRDAAKTVLDKIGDMKPDFAGGIDLVPADDQGRIATEAAPISLIRLLPPQLSYTGRIHEQPVPEIRGVRLRLAVGHSGYAPEAMARKEGRNAAMLIAALEEDPSDAYLWYQLGSEFFIRNQREDALPFFVQSYNLLHPEHPGPDAPRQIDWWHRVTLRLLLTLHALGRLEEAVALGGVETQAWPDSSDLLYVHGSILRARARKLRATHPVLAAEQHAEGTALLVRASQTEDQQRYAGVLDAPGSLLASRVLAQDASTARTSA